MNFIAAVFNFILRSDLPAVNVSRKKDPFFFPLELLSVVEGQRIPSHKLSPSEIRQRVQVILS